MMQLFKYPLACFEKEENGKKGIKRERERAERGSKSCMRSS